MKPVAEMSLFELVNDYVGRSVKCIGQDLAWDPAWEVRAELERRLNAIEGKLARE